MNEYLTGDASGGKQKTFSNYGQIEVGYDGQRAKTDMKGATITESYACLPAFCGMAQGNNPSLSI